MKIKPAGLAVLIGVVVVAVGFVAYPYMDALSKPSAKTEVQTEVSISPGPGPLVTATVPVAPVVIDTPTHSPADAGLSKLLNSTK